MTLLPQENNLAPLDGELYWLQTFIEPREADRLFRVLLDTLAWAEEEIVIAGKAVRVPRLVCWYADADAVYRYSGVRHEPLPWSEELLAIRQTIEEQLGLSFNSVLANLYRDGNDSMGWHADKEKELGRDPVIASLSLGEERRFRIRHNKTRQILDFPLRHGDLLVMAGALQQHWRHCVPKSRVPKRPRINLTFRRIRSAAAP